MGIRGLTTYMKANDDFMEDYELHDSYVIIDGLAVAAELFITSNSDSLIGDDLDKYSNRVEQFFDNLLKCKVKPLVIMDGGIEPKKMNTINARRESHLATITNYSVAFETRIEIIPLTMPTIFESILKKKRIKIVRCIFEGDPHIAGVAKIIDCPVISNDSDFYIFGVKYIPVQTMASFVVEYSWLGHVIPCKIFKPEYLSRTFPCMDLSVLPLLAVLLGNDYMPSNTFDEFLDSVQLSDDNLQQKINKTFKWLANKNLKIGAAAIIKKSPKNHRRKFLHTIELIVNGYIFAPWEMLRPLGLEKQYEDKIAEWRKQKKFQLEDIDITDNKEFYEDSSSEETKDEEPIVDSNIVADTIVSTWPKRLTRHYYLANMPGYIVDVYRGSRTVTIQFEDIKYESCYAISMKIVGVIHGLLVAGNSEKIHQGLSYTMRNKRAIVSYHMNTICNTQSTKLPKLEELIETPRNIRKLIFDDTLEISRYENLINDIPAEWRLYVITIVYWMRQKGEPRRNSCHIYAVLFNMLLSLIDRKIGFYRYSNDFNKRYGETLIELKKKENNEKFIGTRKTSDSIDEAIKSVTENDCIVAAPLFIKYCKIEEGFSKNPQKFNITIVHSFSQLQSCFNGAVHLNSLLGSPYETPNIGDFYNGTMLYNMYNIFDKLSNVEEYIGSILKESANIKNLWSLLTAKVMTILRAECDNANAKKRRNKQVSKKKV